MMPHPKTLVYKSDSGEVPRKLKQVKKYLDKQRQNKVSYTRCKGSPDPKPADAITSGLEREAEAGLSISISKADNDKQIVF
jgi:hypothetical protein